MPLASDAFMKDDVNISHPCLLYIHISDLFHTTQFFAPGAFSNGRVDHSPINEPMMLSLAKCPRVLVPGTKRWSNKIHCSNSLQPLRHIVSASKIMTERYSRIYTSTK
jgi:hypothetical protein